MLIVTLLEALELGLIYSILALGVFLSFRTLNTPELTVDPETYKVTVDGEEITSKPAEKLPLTQLYSLF